MRLDDAVRADVPELVEPDRVERAQDLAEPPVDRSSSASSSRSTSE
jgi:hypothetical protein